MNLLTLFGVFALFHLETCIAIDSWPQESTLKQSKRAIVQSHADFNSNQIPVDESFSHFSQLQGELPFDRELSIFLFKSETKRFYFQTFSPQTNVSLTVTPCETSLRWELFFINSKSIKKLRKRKVRRSKKYYIKFLARKLANDANKQLLLNHTGTQRFTYSEKALQPGLYIVQLSSEGSTDLSAKLYLSSNNAYPYPVIPPVATVLSKQIFPKKSWKYQNDNEGSNDDSDQSNNEQKRQKENNTASVELWWNPALSTESQPSFLFEYCLVVSARRHYQDNCLHYKNNYFNEQESHPEPDSLQLDEIPVGNSYSIKSVDNQLNTETEWWHRAAKRLLQESIQKDFLENVVHFECYNQTKAVVHRLKPKQNYYVDVFVRNQMNGGASRYWTSNFSLAEPSARQNNKKSLDHSVEQLLHDSLFTGVFLDAKNKYRKRLLYKVPSDSTGGNIHVFIQPCDGQGPIQLVVRQTIAELYTDRRKRHDREDNDDDPINNEQMIFGANHDEQSNDQGVLLLEEVTETKTFEITIPIADSNGSIVLEFELNTLAKKLNRNMVLLASSDLSKFPFPRLPHDRTIREFESLRGCRKLTLAWYPSPDERVLYCVLQRDADLMYSSFKESRELCAKINPVKPAAKRALIGGPDDEVLYDTDSSRFITPTRKVICRRYKSSKRRRSNLIMQEVRRLTPGKRYFFQVVISKGRGRSLNYEQVWAETKEASACPSNG